MRIGPQQIAQKEKASRLDDAFDFSKHRLWFGNVVDQTVGDHALKALIFTGELFGIRVFEENCFTQSGALYIQLRHLEHFRGEIGGDDLQR